MANTELKIKILKDSKGTNFLPFSTSKAVFIDGTDKTVDSKLTEIEAAIPTKTSDLTNDSNFAVDANYVHTDNNYTTDEKTKLSGIETGAEVNTIETVKVNGSALTPDVNKAVDVTIPAAAEYTIAEVTATTGYAKSYQLKKDNAFVGAKIDIPKDLVVSSGEVKTVTTQDVPYIGAQVGDKYIDLTLNDPNQNHIYIPVNDLVDAYTAGNGIDISNTNVVSTKIDSSNANGLSTSANGLALTAATTSTAGAMSSTDKSKLDNVEANAEVNIIETIKVNGTALTPDQDRAVDITVAGDASNISYTNTTSGLTADDVQAAIDELADEKVDKVSGKGLSTNDYSTDEKNKLAGIETGAQVNVIEHILVNTTQIPVGQKTVNITVPTKVSDLTNDEGFIDNTVSDLTNYYNKTEIDSKVASVYKYKGNVNTYADLPSSGQSVGDVYNIATADATHGIKAGDNVAWDGAAWDVLAGTVDLSGYQTLIDSTHKLSADLVDDTSTTNKFVTAADKTTWNAKQNALVSGTNIKTINNTSLLGSGDISIPLNKMNFYYDEDTKRPKRSSYVNSVIPYDTFTPGTNNEIYLVDLSVCTSPYGYVQFGIGEGDVEEWIDLEDNDIIIPYHSVSGQYSVGDNFILIRDITLTKYTVTEITDGEVTQITKTSSSDIEHVHHIPAGVYQNRAVFKGDINVNDAVLTKDFQLDGTIISGFTFPIGTLFFFKYDASAGPSALAAPGLIIMPTGEMYQVTELGTLIIKGTTIKPYVDLTSNQTIGGVKTFSSVPVCATQPTSNDELANKAYVDTKQDALVSGTNIKTINNESLLGSGDIAISISLPNSRISWGTSVGTSPIFNDLVQGNIYVVKFTYSTNTVAYLRYRKPDESITSITMHSVAPEIMDANGPILLITTSDTTCELHYVSDNKYYVCTVTYNSSTGLLTANNEVFHIPHLAYIASAMGAPNAPVAITSDMINRIKGKNKAYYINIGQNKNGNKALRLYLSINGGSTINITNTNYKVVGDIKIYAVDLDDYGIAVGVIVHVPTHLGMYVFKIDTSDNSVTDLIKPNGDILQYTGYSSSATQVLSHDSSGNKTWIANGGSSTIDSISVNGTSLTPDINKNVDIPVPTEAKDITCTLKIENPINWSTITWSDFSPSSASYIWTDGIDTYYSSGSNGKIFNKNTKTWESKTLDNSPAFFSAKNVWTNGTDTYYSSGGTNKVLNRATSAWNTKTWSFSDPTINFNGSDVWTDGTDIYVYVEGYGYYVLNGSSWSEKTFYGIDQYSLYTFDASCVWTDGTDIYYNGLNAEDVFVSLVLNKNTSTWSVKSWAGLADFYGKYIWTDGTNIYYSNGANQYKLDKNTSTWSAKSWTGLTSFDRQYIWIVDEDVYYSNSNNQYKLDSAQTISVQEALNFILQNMDYAKNLYTNPSDTSDKNIWIETNNS